MSITCQSAESGLDAGTDVAATLDVTSEREAVLARVAQELGEWPPLLQRQWSVFQPLESAPVGDAFRVMSFNILADSKQGEEQWESTPPEALKWNFRRWRLLEELLAHDADVICVQEFDHVEDFFKPALAKLGFDAVIRYRPAPAEDSVAVLFRQARFCLCHSDLSLDCAAVACLQDRRSGARLVIVSAHLKPGKDAKSEATRAEQAEQVKYLAKACTLGSWALQSGAETQPVVLIAADLNAEARTDAKIGEPLAYRVMRNREVAFGLDSAYAAMPGALPVEDGAEPAYTTWKCRPKGEIRRTIDFIFHDKLLHVAALLNMPQEEEMPEERVPTFSYPSDHLSLVVEFRPVLSAATET